MRVKRTLTAASLAVAAALACGQPALAAAPTASNGPDASAPVRLVNASGGQRLGIWGDSHSANIDAVADASSAYYPRKTEVWKLHTDVSGYTTIENGASGMCLEPVNVTAPTVGMRIRQQACDGSKAQEWHFTDYGPSKLHKYLITARRAPNYAITVENWGNTDWSYVVLDHAFASSNRLWTPYAE